MTRDLTVADRLPEVGDRIKTRNSLNGKTKEYLVEAIRPDTYDQRRKRIGLYECWLWYSREDLREAVYTERADNGPVTVETEEV